MNKAILTSFMILCLLSILLLMEYKISVKADTNIIYVPTEEHPTIQEAINNATEGDTIFVLSGTYYERVMLNKSVSLVGEDVDSTIIDGDENGTVIFITANNVNIEGFTVKRSGSDASGIFLDHDTNGNYISHNIITNNYEGIALHHYCSNNVVSGNTIYSNNYGGISLYSSSNNVVSRNTITGNYGGISLYSSSNNVVSRNTITGNYEGISLALYSNNNVVSGNTIYSNNYGGISLYSSSNNVVSRNTITGNYEGISLALYSNNNTIYLNNFNNTYQVWTDSTSVWDDEDEGNYWSDYTGQDLNEDGIGDTLYRIDENNQDNHPLMGMFSDFKVTLETETYYVTTICNSTISEFRFVTGRETGNKIISFNVTGKDSTVGFCRVVIPTELMNYPYIVLVGVEEIVPTLLDVSTETYVYLYFTHIHSSHTITIISSKTLYLYNELLDKHVKLQMNLYDLNVTYFDILDNYSILLGNYSQLQESYLEFNNSYQEHLSDYSSNVHNMRNLMYIFAATTAIFIITTIYLSKHAHAGKTKVFEDTQKKRTP